MQRYTWFYTLAETLTESEEQTLKAAFDAFTNQWKSHGQPIQGLIKMRYKRFVIVQSDQGDDRPSGCSIDNMKRNVANILEKHQHNTLDAAWVSFKEGDQIRSVHFRDIPSLVKEGVLKPDTTVFDHSLSQSDDLSKWEVPMSVTWLSRFLPKNEVNS